jgi:hypothetical protein
MARSGEKRMEESKGKKTTLLNQRTRLLLITLAGFLVFLWLASAAGPAHAAGISVPGRWTPGEGGGGGTPPPPPSYLIEGWVFNRQTGQPASGMSVCLSWGYPLGFCPCDCTLPVLTDSSGHFKFTNSYVLDYNLHGIQAGYQYYISVNGWLDPLNNAGNLGQECDNPLWCQWLGYVTANGNAYASINIYLEPSTVVNVTYAAFYSNTQFATLYYGLSNQGEFHHNLEFNVLSSGISIGYSISRSETFTGAVWGTRSIAFQRIHYAYALYDSTIASPGVVKAGVGDLKPYTGFYNTPISEYITNPQGLFDTDSNHCYNFGMAEQSSQTYYYSETSSHTWGVSGSPFAIIFSAWSNVVTIDETVTTSSTSDVTMYVAVPHGYGYVNFMAYCPGQAGTRFDPLLSPSVGTGGFELHVFDMSGKG